MPGTHFLIFWNLLLDTNIRTPYVTRYRKYRKSQNFSPPEPPRSLPAFFCTYRCLLRAIRTPSYLNMFSQLVVFSMSLEMTLNDHSTMTQRSESLYAQPLPEHTSIYHINSAGTADLKGCAPLSAGQEEELQVRRGPGTAPADEQAHHVNNLPSRPLQTRVPFPIHSQKR